MKHLVQEDKNKIDKNPNEIRQWVSEVIDFSSEYDDVIIIIYRICEFAATMISILVRIRFDFNSIVAEFEILIRFGKFAKS